MIRYTYDVLGRITAAVPDGARGELFAYDATGNVHTADGAPALRAYDAGDRLLQRGTTRFSWDRQGRLSERRTQTGEGERVASLDWAAAGTLSSVETNDGMLVKFSYDPFGRRVTKEVYRRPAPFEPPLLLRRTRFYWHEDTMLHEVTEASDMRFERRYHVGTDGEPWAHREIRSQGSGPPDESWVHYVNDVAGFPERLVDGAGQVIGEIQRTAWGSVEVRAGSTASTPLRFLGQYADVETGLYYNRYRYYDPETGRYISPDPLELLGGINPFVYAQNSPFIFGDRYGLVYTRIVDNSTDPPTIVSEGYNVTEARGKLPAAGGQIPQSFTNKSCAETQALQRMKNDITADIQREQNTAKAKGNKRQPFRPMTEQEIDAEAKRRLTARFDNPNMSIETFQEKGGPRVDPCDTCGAMIADLQIGHAVVGAKGKRGKYGVYKKPPGY